MLAVYFSGKNMDELADPNSFFYIIIFHYFQETFSYFQPILNSKFISFQDSLPYGYFYSDSINNKNMIDNLVLVIHNSEGVIVAKNLDNNGKVISYLFVTFDSNFTYFFDLILNEEQVKFFENKPYFKLSDLGEINLNDNNILRSFYVFKRVFFSEFTFIDSLMHFFKRSFF